MYIVYCLVKYVVPKLREGAIYEQNTYPSFFPRQNGRFGMVMSFRFLRTGLDHVDQADQANKVEVPTIILGMLESPGFQTYSTQ